MEWQLWHLITNLMRIFAGKINFNSQENLMIFYNLFNRDAILIPVANCLTSFFAGFVIFSYMGYLSKITGQDIDNIIQAGN